VRYFVLFCMVVAFTAGLAIWCMRKMGEAATVAIGTLLTVALIVLFVLNKSDSVADTILEKIRLRASQNVDARQSLNSA